MKILDLMNLSVRYADKVVLDKVNLDVFDNDFIGIIGANGSGKTTLVKMILGLVPYSGEIAYYEDLDKPGKIGYLPQQNNFDNNFPISVRQVILSGMQGPKIPSRPTSQDRAKLDELLELAGVKQLKERQIGQLSGGELQRVLLCRALISSPKLLILDEPANSVDAKFEMELYEILRKLNETTAIIMVSHDVGTITSYVKSIVCVEGAFVHRHENPNPDTAGDCPLQFVSHGEIPYTVLGEHETQI